MEINESSKQPFVLLNEILDKLRHRNLGPALEWAQANCVALMEQSSSLEFKLHRLHFLQLVAEGPSKQAEALAYVRKHFPPFVHQHETGINYLLESTMHTIIWNDRAHFVIIPFEFQIFKT